MSAQTQNEALQTIFAFFLGLVVVAFVGVGVNTFYPAPSTTYEAQSQKLSDQQDAIGNGGDLTAAQQKQSDALQKRIDALDAKDQAVQEAWSRNTSIILVLLATLVMSVSLIRSEQLKVLSNGLLLGGLFTMVYGVGSTVASGTSHARFYVVAFALAVTVALGYLKFVRARRGSPAAVPAATVPDAGAIEARLTTVEARLDATAAALRGAKPRETQP